MVPIIREQEVIQFLHGIVGKYENAALEFYADESHKFSKYPGRFDFKSFAKKCFDSVEACKLENCYVELFRQSGNYMHIHHRSKVGVKNYPTSFLTIPELVLNTILAYQLPTQESHPRETKGEEKDDVDKTEINSTRKKRRNDSTSNKGKKVTVNSRVVLSNEVSLNLLSEILKIPLPHESKIWKQVKYILCPSGCPKLLAKFGEVINNSTKSGFISYNALNFFMHDQTLNTYFDDPATILHALYIGPLSAQTVELFAMNRSNIFRQQCRDVIKKLVDASRDPMNYKRFQPTYLAPSHPDKLSYRDFVNAVNCLVRDLNGEVSQNTCIHAGWACAAIKKFGHKRYVDFTWKDENFYDLIWTVLAQRPHLKKFVVDVLEKNYKDAAAARFWRRMQPYQMSQTVIFNQNINMDDPLKPTQQFLNFPMELSRILTIDTDAEISNLKHLLEARLSREEKVVVGVDAEWSAYRSPSKATILQIALPDSVYILDLESKNVTFNTYCTFLSFLFNSTNIMKIGFQFGEDLHQLRAAFRNCPALYNPNNVVCVGKLMMDVMDVLDQQGKSEALRNDCMFWTETIDKEVTEESIDGVMADDSISAESCESSQTNSDVSKARKDDSTKLQFFNRGLSYICEKLLGRPLDKTEQCSVWDRRPLRNLQKRYAAMDAYCMLMLLDKIKQICCHFELNWNDFLSQQGSIRTSLPLLIELPL